MFKFNLLENERIFGIYRQAESVLFKPVIIIFIAIYFPWYFLLKYELAGQYSRLLFFWTILVLLYAVNKYLLWLLNLYLVTDRRLIAISYKNLINKQVLESPLDRILNIGFVRKGFWQSLFNFGAVVVQASGLPEPMLLKNISKPSEIKDFLWKVHQKFGNTGPRQSAVPTSQ